MNSTIIILLIALFVFIFLESRQVEPFYAPIKKRKNNITSIPNNFYDVLDCRDCKCGWNGIKQPTMCVSKPFTHMNECQCHGNKDIKFDPVVDNLLTNTDGLGRQSYVDSQHFLLFENLIGSPYQL